MRMVLVLLLLTIFFSCMTNAQFSSSENKFMIGAYINVHPAGHDPCFFPNDATMFSLWRPKAFGFNTVFAYVLQPIADTGYLCLQNQGVKESNMDSLKDFPTVIASNGFSSYKVLDGLPNDYIRNFDYIFFYTGAYYSNWDATPTDDEKKYELHLSHDGGQPMGTSWSSLGADSGDILIKGPNYNQEIRYRGSSTDPPLYPWGADLVTYEVTFHMKLVDPPPPSKMDDPVCEIMVHVRYKIDSDTNTLEETLESKILTAGEIAGNPANRQLTYTLDDYCQPMKSTNGMFNDACGKYFVDLEFRVKYLGDNQSHVLLIDSIEVYDENIWEEHLSNEDKRNLAKQNIIDYLSRFKADNPSFYANNLKYFSSIDEPHSVDSYIPMAFVQHVLDSVKKDWGYGPTLFTHLFPEWNGYRNGKEVMPLFNKTVKPQPFHIYYAPYSYQNFPTEYSAINESTFLIFSKYHLNLTYKGIHN